MARHSIETPRFLTPAQAAARSKCGRTRVMKALHNKSLRANRDNQRRWMIDPVDLDAWVKTWPTTPRVTDSVSDGSCTNDTSAALREEIAAARAEIAGLRDRIADRDREIERLDAALHTALTAPRTWLSRLFS